MRHLSRVFFPIPARFAAIFALGDVPHAGEELFVGPGGLEFVDKLMGRVHGGHPGQDRGQEGQRPAVLQPNARGRIHRATGVKAFFVGVFGFHGSFSKVPAFFFLPEGRAWVGFKPRPATPENKTPRRWRRVCVQSGGVYERPPNVIPLTFPNLSHSYWENYSLTGEYHVKRLEAAPPS